MSETKKSVQPQPLHFPKPRYSIAEACELLGIKRTRLYQHVKSGRLRLIKDGARSFVLHDELVALSAAGAPPREPYPNESTQAQQVTPDDF